MENKSEIFDSRINLEDVKIGIEKIKTELKKVIFGQNKMIDLLIIALLADGHVLIEGFPGLAKTLTAKLLARTIDSGFNRIQFTPDMMPSDILGTVVFNAKNSNFEFKKGPVFSNFILIDEINRAPAKTQSALFEVMEERQVTIEGTTYKMDMPFIIIGTQNPIDMEGTYQLPEAQMDRFLFMVNIDYPSLDNEVSIIESHHNLKNIKKENNIDKVISGDDIKKYQTLVKQVIVEDHLFKFIALIVEKTRNHRDIIIGASPRASLALLDGAKALAVMNGKDYITPDDIIYLADAVLSHRIIITPEKEMEGVKPSKIINSIIKSIEIPR